jgi:hypothetical protein
MERMPAMSANGTQLKFTGHHGYGCLPPHCRRSASEAELRAVFAGPDAVIRTESAVGDYDQIF